MEYMQLKQSKETHYRKSKIEMLKNDLKNMLNKSNNESPTTSQFSARNNRFSLDNGSTYSNPPHFAF